MNNYPSYGDCPVPSPQGCQRVNRLTDCLDSRIRNTIREALCVSNSSQNWRFAALATVSDEFESEGDCT